MCTYSELFWSIFSGIHNQSECGKIRARINTNTDAFHLGTHIGFCIFSCRTLNNFNKLLVIVALQNELIDYVSNITSKRHRIFTESFYLLKCSQNQKNTQNLVLADSRNHLLEITYMQYLYCNK